MIKRIYHWFFHSWKLRNVAKSLSVRGVIKSRYCTICGKHQIKKNWGHRYKTGWMNTIGRINLETEEFES